jgi:hypothetical protein
MGLAGGGGQTAAREAEHVRATIGEPEPEPEAGQRALRTFAPRHLLIWCLLASGTALMLASLSTPGSRPPHIDGLPDAGGLTGWGLPATRAFVDLTAACAVGSLVLTVLLPAAGANLTDQARKLLRAASRWATAWAAGCLLAVLFTVS